MNILEIPGLEFDIDKFGNDIDLSVDDKWYTKTTSSGFFTTPDGKAWKYTCDYQLSLDLTTPGANDERGSI